MTPRRRRRRTTDSNGRQVNE